MESAPLSIAPLMDPVMSCRLLLLGEEPVNEGKVECGDNSLVLSYH